MSFTLSMAVVAGRDAEIGHGPPEAPAHAGATRPSPSGRSARPARRHTSRAQPASIDAQRPCIPALQVNYTCLLHCLDFGSSYDDMLLQKMGRTSRECVEFGLMSLHLDGRNMDARYLANFSRQNVSN